MRTETLLDVGRQVRGALRLLRYEWRSRHQTPFNIRQRLACLRGGFSSVSAALYGLEGAPDSRLYVSDWRDGALAKRPNLAHSALTENKLLFWLVMRNLSPRVAPVLGIARCGRFLPLSPGDGRHRSVEDLLRGAEYPLVLKPPLGSGGEGVLIIELEPGCERLNGRPATLETIVRLIGTNEYLVVPRIEQAAYAREIFPGSVNTIRVMTMTDVDTGRAFIPCCVHRFGTSRTVPVDAFFRGGIVAPIDLATGVLGSSVAAVTQGGRRVIADTHPDSGVRIKGVKIPNWHALCDHLLALADQLSFLPYIGWDIAATDDGFLINEGNSQPSLRLLQVCGPILTDKRVAAFLKFHRII